MTQDQDHTRDIVRQAAQALAALGASKGGKARAQALDHVQRVEIAKQGGRAYASLPPEIRREASLRGWQTRRENAARNKAATHG